MTRRISITAPALLLAAIFLAVPALARTKMTALPERGRCVIRMDNPAATLIQEDRVLTLQKGKNNVDFSWNGVAVDPDSIRLEILSPKASVRLISVSYPPNENALVWYVWSDAPAEARVRIAYLMAGIDGLAAYKGVLNEKETGMDFSSFLVVRNFSGEDFAKARVVLPGAPAFERPIGHEETVRRLVAEKASVPVVKVWTFDAALLPWDPEKESGNVGIPVSYRAENTGAALGGTPLQPGKVRLFQADGKGGTVFVGEDSTDFVPAGKPLSVTTGQSRDIVVTQRKMKEDRINIRRNSGGGVVLYDTDEVITAKVENFKDAPAVLTLIQHIPGQWDMEECNMDYVKKDSETLEFTVRLAPRSKKELSMHYHRRNIRD